MVRQSELVKFQVAGQSDTKHLGEIHQKKGKPHSARRPVRNTSDKKLKNSPPVQPCSPLNVQELRQVLGVIAYTNKIKFAQREGKDVQNVTNQVILLLFAV